MRKLVLLVTVLAGCGGDDACDPVGNTGCDTGLVCEASSSGGDPICAKPLVLRGRVFRIDTDAAIEGARVVALDANGSPSSPVATTDVDGTYSLTVPSPRDDMGRPAGAPKVTLRADAAGYLTFPSGIRVALPVDTGAANAADDEFVLMSALTDIGLFVLDGAGTGRITGTVEVPPTRTGVLVAAQLGDTGYTAIADSSGSFVIFNLDAGSYDIAAYAKGVNYTPVTAEITAGQTTTANLVIDDAKPTSTVSGSVNLVNPESGEATSVILVLESTFNPTLLRGETPPGLRAPAPGTAPNITNAFSIDGVPEGRYVVLAAFENENLVRDPDTAIGGTQIAHIDVVSGADSPIGTSFKITGALDVLGPGVEAPEAVTDKPLLRWKRDPGADRYTVRVYDALGAEVWFKTDILPPGSADLSVPYEGPLDAGMYYQFRAWSIKQGGTFISNTEDLRGLFFLP